VEALIKTLFKTSIEKGEHVYTSAEIESNWIGSQPALSEEITNAELRIKQTLPPDYKELMGITNGFKTSNDSLEPSFLPIQEIDYLKNVIPFIIECYEDTLPELEESILIAGKNEEQQFLLIPPTAKRSEWKYWKFANWHAGEREFKGIQDYIESVISFLIEN